MEIRKKTAFLSLRDAQIRVLKALAGGGLLSRAKVADRAGFSSGGAIGQAINGLQSDTPSKDSYPGLLELGLIEKVELDIDGLIETSLQITDKGLQAVKNCGIIRL